MRGADPEFRFPGSRRRVISASLDGLAELSQVSRAAISALEQGTGPREAALTSSSAARPAERKRQALIAGFGDAVEQKTHPRRFIALTRSFNFDLNDHQRLYDTDGDGRFGSGTHPFFLGHARS